MNSFADQPASVNPLADNVQLPQKIGDTPLSAPQQQMLNPNRTACGLSCTYDKAAEQQTFEALYTQRKLAEIENFINDKIDSPNSKPNWTLKNTQNTDDQERLNNIREELKSYKVGSDTDQDSFNRYKLVVTRHLRKLRQAMNENSANSGVYREWANGDGKEMPKIAESNSDDPKLAQQPYIPTMKELNVSLEKMRAEQLAGMGANDFKTEMTKFPIKPSLDEFVEFEDVAQYPGQDASDHTIRVKKNPDGSIKYDKAAYQAALEKYNLQFSSQSKNKNANPGTDPTLKYDLWDKYAQAVNSTGRPILRKNGKDGVIVKDRESKTPLTAQEEVTTKFAQEIYDATRKDVIDQFEKQQLPALSQATGQKDKSASGRKTASAQPSTTKNEIEVSDKISNQIDNNSITGEEKIKERPASVQPQVYRLRWSVGDMDQTLKNLEK